MDDPHSIRIRILYNDRLAKNGLAASLAAFADFELVDDGGETDPAESWFDSGLDEVVVADLDCAMKLVDRAVHDGRAIASSLPIVVVPGPDRERELKQALRSRVQGYLVSGFTVEQLADSVRTVHRGARYLCPRAASRLAESICFSPLTDREEAVLELMAKGLCNKSIARQLGVALGTVKSHLKSAYSKLFVGSRTQAVIVSERRGLLARRQDAWRPGDLLPSRFS